ncbi:hypothetical protein OHA21_26815 [Actinoplanes sp. NBC_00393]|uniref:hypothetical protein n=1 Tax=Actinoplanes sp. NBC_00393 TaxID=2975953 RepID=UPI002E1BE532
MSWWMHAVPLSGSTGAETLEWAASASFSRGVPEQMPASRPLPSVRDVLAAFRAAGCHGTAWFDLIGTAEPLEECPDPGTCYSAGGLDLGEVRLSMVEASVEAVSFRKPVPVAVLTAASALASTAGPQLVFDDSADSLFVVWPGESAESLLAEWPW